MEDEIILKPSNPHQLSTHDDFEINVKAELEIEMLHQKIDLMKEQEFLFLTEAIKELSIKIDRYQPS
jgi:uncharacterized membrane protein